MNKMEYCVTHCETLQIPQQDFFYALFYVYVLFFVLFLVFFFSFGGQGVDTEAQEMSEIGIHNGKHTKNQ